ncbi:MAG: family 16 glycoside hydrolase, partial [Oscillospiraceae bacterium]
ETEYTVPAEADNTVLSLPYSDDFNYTDEFLSARGGAPLYTTDEGGAFEVTEKDGEKVLMQKITLDIKADEWGGTPEPTTIFGDDRWYNYSVSADVLTDGENSYAGVGMRYILADSGKSGYGVTLYEDGSWKFIIGRESVESGVIVDFDASKWHNVKISALYDDVSVYIDGEKVLDYNADGARYSAGRAALYSSYNNCCFDNVKVEATDTVSPYVNKLDNFDSAFTYSTDGWNHKTMDSFKNYKRTISKGSEGAFAEIEFEGTGIVLTGVQTGESVISVEIDGKVIEKEHNVPKMSNRQSFVSVNGLDDGKHTLKFTVVSGECAVDAAQVVYDYEAAAAKAEEEKAAEEQAVSDADTAETTGENTSETESEQENTKKSSPTVPIAIGAAAAAVAAAVVIGIKKE